eukprot:scaffold143108_cov32-Tisochrysis_lutea.AAC.3
MCRQAWGVTRPWGVSSNHRRAQVQCREQCPAIGDGSTKRLFQGCCYKSACPSDFGKRGAPVRPHVIGVECVERHW